MNRITKFANVSIPAIVGAGIAWIGIRIIRNEKKIEARRIELKLQLKHRSNED